MENEIMIRQQAILSCDFEKIKKRLNDQLGIYSSMVFTEEAKKDAKNTVAELRKEKKAFADQVKAIKAEYMKPFDEFYAQASEIVDLYDKPIVAINEQIEAFEAQRIEDKVAQIKAIYADLVTDPEMLDVIPLSKIYNKKWENATFTAKQIKDEIVNKQIWAKDALNIIRNMKSDKEKEAIERFKLFLDLNDCLSFITSYENSKKEIMAREEERLKQETEERIRAEERAKIVEEQKQAEALAEAQEQARNEVIDNLIPVAEEGAVSSDYAYMITLTPAEKEALEVYMNSVGIEFEIMP